MTRKLKKGGYTAILSVIVIAVVVIINMIVGRLPEKVRQWDMSSSQIYSVGDTTKEVLAGLTEDVTIYVVADPASVDARITSFVNRYADLSSHIKVEMVDSVLHPERVNELDAENNTIFLSCPSTGKTETVALTDIIKYDQQAYYYYQQMIETEFDGEGQITSAISYVANDVQKTVYVMEGHGEVALGTVVSDMLTKSNLTTASLNLLKDGEIPEDCELLMMNAPENDLADDEKTILINYLNGGGKAMIIAGYSEKERPNLQSVLNEYGLNFENGLAADTKSCYQNNPYNVFPTLDAGNDIMAGIDTKGTALVPQSAALTQLETLPDGITVSPFMETTDGGILVTEDGQVPGTYILGAVAEKTLDSGVARLTVLTTPGLIDDGLNSSFTNLLNLDIFMNAVTTNFEDVSNVSIASKSLEVAQNTVTNGGTWGILFTIIIPIITLAFGLVIWLKRRRL